MDFDAYSTPYAHAMYSESFFRNIIFENASGVLDSLPFFLPNNSIRHWVFSQDVPMSAVSTVITVGETVINPTDLLPIMQELRSAFAEGARSVDITVCIDGLDTLRKYHFSKLRLYTQIHNHHEGLKAAAQLYNVFVSQLGLPAQIIKELGNTCAFLSLSGFHGTVQCPLWKLVCLLDENWLEDDIMNMLAELLYLRIVIHKPDPSFLYLPTFFLRDARYLFQHGKVYSPNILALRYKLRTSHVNTIACIAFKNNHFSALIYDTKAGQIIRGDSGGSSGSEDADIVPIFRWIFEGLDYDVGPHLINGPIALQQGGGFGSCGVAAHNFIESWVDDEVMQWEPTGSEAFRFNALRDLVIYHCLAVDSEKLDCDSTHPKSFMRRSIPKDIILCAGKTTKVDGPIGFTDFTIHVPLEIHPIFKFVDHLKTYPSSLVIRATRPPLEAKALAKTSLLPVHQLISPSIIMSESGIDIVDMTTRKASPTPSSPLPKYELDDVDIIDLTYSSPIRMTTRKKQSPLPDMHLLSPTLLCSEKNRVASPEILFVSPSAARHLKYPQCQQSVSDVSPANPNSLKRSSSVVSILSDSVEPSSLSPTASESRNIVPTNTTIRTGAVYTSLEAARNAIYHQQEGVGEIWRTSQTKKDGNGGIKKVTFRCRCYYHHKPTHKMGIDPSDHREGKTVKTGCMAHVNVNRIQASGLWHTTMVSLQHNHPRSIPPGGSARRPPTEAHRQVVSLYNSKGNFDRKQVATILRERVPGHPLEPRQISNLLNQARHAEKDAVVEAGGDIASTISWLEKKQTEEHGWIYRVRLDENQVVTALWWQSPTQNELARRYWDILLNDGTYNRNQYQYVLSIGIVIDGFAKSRNAWYAFQKREDLETMSWILQCHQESTGRDPSIFASDRHASLIAAVERVMPLTRRIICLHHLTGNISQQVRLTLGSEWNGFNHAFWAVYRAVSPDEFERLWKNLLGAYPAASRYLQNELYPCRHQWAWAWVATTFTAGIRTNGRVESENRMNKQIGGPKKTFFQLFLGLVERSSDQTEAETIRVRDSSRQQHDSPIETMFPAVLSMLRKYAGPYALHTCFREMKLCLGYQASVLQLPDGMPSWTEYTIRLGNELGFEWENGEENRGFNAFTNDKSYVSTKWLVHLVTRQNLRIRHLLKVIHRGTSATHYIALLDNNHFVCDCCMSANLGIPCRHYFQVLLSKSDLKFHIGLIQARWYQDPTINPLKVASVSTHDLREIPELRHGMAFLSNPLATPYPSTPPPSTETIGSRVALHEANMKLRPLLNHVQTREELNDLLQKLDTISHDQEQQQRRETIKDPCVVKHKGRPRTTRLTGSLEGAPRGGGPNKRPRLDSNNPANHEGEGHAKTTATEHGRDAAVGAPLPVGLAATTIRKCTKCRLPGHNRTSCTYTTG